nr:immunoglobulin heavy chain junction region [Macaca mulatta]MOY29867.1 immunoglobulin heavy chain junction region [Macaca mulatta]MOY30186.1 immunoglobulin heavy chain junction region [Macaca mulatta]
CARSGYSLFDCW